MVERQLPKLHTGVRFPSPAPQQLGAEKFGWSKRNPQAGQMRDRGLLVGWGMATATYPAAQNGGGGESDPARQRSGNGAVRDP